MKVFEQPQELFVSKKILMNEFNTDHRNPIF
jgi:hypothetical protein